jgi:hypothetical protein
MNMYMPTSIPDSACGYFLIAILLLLFAVLAVPVLWGIVVVFYWGIVTMFITGLTMVFGIL